MAIPVEEIEAIIEEAEQGHFSIDDLRDLAAKYRKEDKFVDIVAIFTGPVEDGVNNESGFYHLFSKQLSAWASEQGFECHVEEVLEKNENYEPKKGLLWDDKHN